MKLKLYFFALLFLQQFMSFGQTLDQSNTIISATTSGASIGQSFTPGLTGKLSKFIYFNNFMSTNTYPLNFKLKIYQGGGNTGALLGEQSFTLTSTTPNGEFEIVISSIINVTAGNLYTAYFIPDNGMSGILFSSTAANSYSGGSIYNGNSPFVPSDLYFKTFVTVPATHLNFDGVNDFIALPNESNFDFTNQMTVEAWVKSNVAPEQWDALVIKGDNSWRLHLNSTGTVNFTCSGTSSSQVNSTSSVTDGNWHHIVGTLGGNSIKIYVDGVLENVVTTSGNINNTVDQVLIGNNPTFGPRHFNGNMEEVRIWNVARTTEQISASKNCELQGTETGLVAYYKFNQGIAGQDNTAITSLLDATSNANNGTLVNFTKTGTTSNFLAGSPVTTGSIIPSVATVTTPVTYTQGATATALTATVGANGTSLVWYTTATGGTGTTAPTPSTATVGSNSYWVSSTNANGCESARTEIVVQVALPATHLNFGGSNDYVDCGNSPSLQITGNTITLEAYVKFNTFASDPFLGNIINKNSNTASGYMLRAGGNGVVNFVVANNGWSEIFSPQNSISLNTWHHIAGVYNGANLKIYVDGIEVASQPLSVTIGNANINLNIGRDPDNTIRNLDASLDDVRVWNVARTAEQINGSKNCELQGTETGLVAYYKFNQGIAGQDNTAITSLLDATANANNGTLVNFTKTGTTSNFLAGSPVTTGSIIPSLATVTSPVTYTQGATATALTATVGANGTSLVWYTTATGGTGTTAPTPSAATVGSTSYWVSSANANGCESTRTQIVVNVIAPATHLNFDGVNDYVNLSNLISGGSSYTKQAMIRPTNISSGAGHNILSNSNEVFWIFGGNIRAGNNGNFQHVLANASSLLNTWNMVTVTYDAPTTTMKLYINEILVSENNSVSATVGGNIQIGAFASIAVFNGDIDEVRIWNRALTATEIVNTKNCELQGNETGLAAYYKFNQGIDALDNSSISSLTDASGNANNGTLSGFTKTGATSNFLAGSPIVTGTTCTTLNTSNFEVSNNIKMYPNPTNNIVTVEVNDLTNAKLQVVDITGKILMNQALNTSSNTVDVTQLPTGMYFFKVTSNEGTTTNKIVKN
jgi:Concanavalin A-like lectin/glucanases superfamily/Secretion system C-terminal sorting domain/Ig-like domain CHU_C associated